ncbi:hypothetical protein GVY41_19535 [Frigidibacter albus]|uniref:TnsA endonuclease N-terminal domain-containing protein n=1 Tax=Frigidibacter albus TaxID=1465486 RepID=A0A6L8VMG5_9RHOB|nr:hypothetical protein [Frigidibacter albus]MZQ91274.1 hypothetical protein [Frigidibacter albus]NBE33189.1 hypothetical protein [Frigidibacter albus]GGH63701.1 hypothetical protein GCM10011341_39020 [Frigidibacter albus]
MKPSASIHFLPDPAKGRAVRPIPKASQGHFVGEFVFGVEKPQRVGFASLLEFKAAICTVYRPGFVDLEEQLAPMAFRKLDGKVGHHHFDYRATFSNGLRIGIAVKPSHIADRPEFRAEMRAVAEAAVPTVVDRMAVVTERNIHPIEFFNAKLFHAARRPVQEEDRVIDDLRSSLTGPVTVGHLIDQGRHGGVSLFGIARAIHGGGLRLVRKERVDHSALVAANADEVVA